MSMIGADPDALDQLAVALDGAATQLEGIRSSVRSQIYSAAWRGPGADHFRSAWEGQHTRALNAAAAALQDSSGDLRRNAAEQRQASGGDARAGVALSFASTSSPVRGDWFDDFGASLRSVDEYAGLAGIGMGAVGLFTKSGGLKLGGTTVGHFGTAVNAYAAVEHVRGGRYVDATLEAGFIAGDTAADALKKKGSAVGYVGGVALQTWVEVGREARNVDWSSDGIRQIQQASLSDWGAAFGEALTQMPAKLVKIGKFW